MFVDFRYVTSDPDDRTVLIENETYILKEEWPWLELHRVTAPQASWNLSETRPTEWTVFHGENKKMSIHDFRSRFVSGGERNVLFVALRRLSLLQDPQSLFAAAEEEVGWPIWDENGQEPPTVQGARA